MIGLRRGIAVLNVLAQRADGGSFTELQRACSNLAPPTLSRLLKALASERLIEKRAADGRYVAGPELFTLARTVLGLASARDLVQPSLDRLADLTGQSSAYFERAADAMVLVAKREHAQSWNYLPVGGTHPKITRNGFGQVLLAQMPAPKLATLLDKTQEPLPTARAAFLKRLARIRKQGLFVERGEAARALVRIVAPVFAGPQGPFAGAIGITLLKGALAKPEFAACKPRVREAARDATRRMETKCPT